MIDVVTNLLGEIVEIYTWDNYRDSRGYSLRGRGTVRAVYVADKTLMVLVEHNLGFDSSSYDDRTKDGGFEMYSLHEGRARVVQRCARCSMWDQKALLVQLGVQVAGNVQKYTSSVWEHKAGEGCKKVERDAEAR